MEQNEKPPANSWQTNVIGLGFLILLLFAIATPIALLIDFITYNPGTAVSAAGYALPVIVIGLGIIWLVTRAKSPAQPVRVEAQAGATPRFNLRAWWAKWRPVIHDLSAILGIPTGIAAILGWFAK